VNFLADESVDQPVVNVVAIAELQPSLLDDVVLSKSTDSNALLLTTDKDFGELVFRQQQVTAGVVLIRLSGLSVEAKQDLVSAASREHESELRDAFTVISPGTVRIRRTT
jgi:predicted nuclease of predicted toxin-antitoxin system